jgi:dCTP deaminase
MSLLSDKSILDRCENEKMIQPFSPTSVKTGDDDERIASYGVSSGGYDLRAAPEFKLFIPPKTTFWQRLKYLITGAIPEHEALDYKNIREDQFHSVTGSKIVVPPGGFLLTRSKEYVKMPRDLIALCIGKSTIARVGWNCLCTPIEPGWEGYITFEFHNTTNQPNTFYANEGVLQLVFLELDQACAVSYADRGGKYQNQAKQIVLPMV